MYHCSHAVFILYLCAAEKGIDGSPKTQSTSNFPPFGQKFQIVIFSRYPDKICFVHPDPIEDAQFLKAGHFSRNRRIYIYEISPFLVPYTELISTERSWAVKVQVRYAHYGTYVEVASKKFCDISMLMV